MNLVDTETGEIAKRIARRENVIFSFPKIVHIPGEITRATIGELMDNRVSNGRKVTKNYPRCCIYIIRDTEKRVLYVGFTNIHIRNRLRGHFSGKSAIGVAIRQAFPQSNSWEIEMICAENRKAAMEKERGIINELQPIYNKTGTHT